VFTQSTHYPISIRLLSSPNELTNVDSLLPKHRRTSRGNTMRQPARDPIIFAANGIVSDDNYNDFLEQLIPKPQRRSVIKNNEFNVVFEYI
jgi:hypothetical protein